MQEQSKALLSHILSQPKGQADFLEFTLKTIMGKPTPEAFELLCDFFATQPPENQKLFGFSQVRNYFRTSIKKGALSISEWTEWIEKFDFIKPQAGHMGSLTKFLAEEKPTGYQTLLDKLNNKNSASPFFNVVSEIITHIQKAEPISKVTLEQLGLAHQNSKKLSTEEKKESRSQKNLLLLNIALKPHPQMGEVIDKLDTGPEDIFKIVVTQKKETVLRSVKELVNLVDWSRYIDPETAPKEIWGFRGAFLDMVIAGNKKSLDLGAFGASRHLYLYAKKTEDYEDEDSADGYTYKKSGQRNYFSLLLTLQKTFDMNIAELKDTVALYTPILKHNFSIQDPHNLKPEYDGLELFFQEVVPQLKKDKKLKESKLFVSLLQELTVSYEKMKLESSLNTQPEQSIKSKFKI